MPCSSPSRGFTLIELAVVLAIVGLLMTAFLRFYEILDQKQRIETTRARLEELRTALIYYVLTHNRLPCPASPLPGANRDQDACAPDATSPPEGVDSHSVVVNDQNKHDESLDIWEGVVPVRDLQLDPQLGTDGWGDVFTYAVSRNVTLPGGMRGNPAPKGHISVVDADGNNLLETPDTGRYVIISHGPSGGGAWTHDGKRRPCPERTLASKNCESGGAYVMAPYSTARGEKFFDNIVIDDDINASGTLLDRIAICTRKLMFYEPGEPTSDKDGCSPAANDNGAWHGVCLTMTDINARPSVREILRPAVAQGSACGCVPGLGLASKMVGSWLQAPENAAGPPGASMMTLYTCVRP